MTFCVYLTHPEVQIDPAVPVPDWGLSQIGRDRAAHAGKLHWAAKIRRVISSKERKAIETAEIFAEPFELPVETDATFHENDRSATGFLPPPEFEATADQFFTNPEQSIRGWERAVDAQTRIVRAVKTVVLNTPDSDPILFSGHGGVGTLLKCHLMGVPISRKHDQSGGGHYYLFEKSALTEQSTGALDWNRL